MRLADRARRLLTASTAHAARGLARRGGIWMAVVAAAGVAAAAQPVQSDVDLLLSRVSSRVETYYSRAQSIICTETVHLQSIDTEWTPIDFGRTLVYDLRVEWDSTSDLDKPPEPVVVRQLRMVNGRPPKPKDEPGCMDPKPVTPDALAMLLPTHRGEYLFKFAGLGHTDKRSAMMLDYRGRKPGKGEVTWNGECVSVDLPGHFRGRVWVDEDTKDVLRVDEYLVGLYEFPVPRDRNHVGGAASMVVERADSSTRYRPIAFHDPEEILVLPESIETLQIVRNSGFPRMRISQTFKDYRRFLTGGRVVKPGIPR